MSSFLIVIILFYFASSAAKITIDPGAIDKAAIKPASVGPRHIDLDAAIAATLGTFDPFHHLILFAIY